MRQLASTAAHAERKSSSDKGRISTRLTEAGEWMGTGAAALVVVAIVTGVMGMQVPIVPWAFTLATLWTGHAMLREAAKGLAAKRWDALLALALRNLAAEGAQLPPDLLRLRAMLDRGPIAVEVWKSLPPADTLCMIRLSAQLVDACSVRPPPAIELGGDASEAASRVIELMEEVRTVPDAPVLRLR